MNPRFHLRKRHILSSLCVPTAEYTDASPKGSVDEPIRGLIEEINVVEGLVTTSSCSGRISVFVEGWRGGDVAWEGEREGKEEAGEEENVGVGKSGDEDVGAPETRTRAGPGGKGGGGTWLFVSHDPVLGTGAHPNYTSMFGLSQSSTTPERSVEPSAKTRFIHFKFEPMILHILTASPLSAQHVLTAALAAGFRESGAINLSSSSTAPDDAMPMVAIRSSGYALDCIIGYRCAESERNVTVVSEEYLAILVGVANQRFETNKRRIARFREALLEGNRGVKSGDATKGKGEVEWEDAVVRRRRKREEGLARQRALRDLGLQKGVNEETKGAAEGLDEFSGVVELQKNGCPGFKD